METRTAPSPDGHTFRHSITAQTLREPPKVYSDVFADLERLENGNVYPMVITYPTLPTDGTWTIEVSILSESFDPNPEQIATLEGTPAEVVAETRL